MKFNATIKGIAPLLMHRFSEEMITKVKSRTGDKRLSDADKRKAAEQFLYLHKGKLVQPAAHIEGAMVKASTELKLAGQGKKTYKDTMKASCFVFPENIPHKNQKWVVDSRSVVNPTTRGEVLDDRADPDAIKEILRLAGLRNGVGSYRPRFGRFEVVKFTQVKG